LKLCFLIKYYTLKEKVQNSKIDPEPTSKKPMPQCPLPQKLNSENVTDWNSKIGFHWESVNTLMNCNVNIHAVPFYFMSHLFYFISLVMVNRNSPNFIEINDKKNNSPIMTLELLFKTYYVLDVKCPESLFNFFVFLENLKYHII